jgi:hypothetical protein
VFLFACFYIELCLYVDNEYNEILKDMGNGLSLVSIQNLNPCEDIENKTNTRSAVVKKEEIFQEKSSIQQQQQDETISSLSSYEPTEQERILFEKMCDNRMRIQMQHQQLMMKAARLVCFSSINNDSLNRKSTQCNNQLDLQTMKCIRY